MSNLSVAQTSSSGLILCRASVMTFRFLCRSYAFFEVKKVKLRFPRSWKTVPPPLRLRARGIPALLMNDRLHSAQGFWWRPMTTAGRFLQSRRMLRCCRSTFESIQSSRARFWYTSVDCERKISPLSPLNRSLLDAELVRNDWALDRQQPPTWDSVFLRIDITAVSSLSWASFKCLNIFIIYSVQLQVTFWLQQH